MAVRNSAGDRHHLAGRQHLLTTQRGPDRLDRCLGQRGDVGQRLMLDLPVLTEGAPHQMTAVLALTARLVHPTTRHSGYMHRA
jgi:hypothetical protein